MGAKRAFKFSHHAQPGGGAECRAALQVRQRHFALYPVHRVIPADRWLNRYGQPYKPATDQQEEVGIKYQPNSKTLLTAAVFNLTQQNVRITDPNDAFNQIRVGKIRSRGVELEAKSEINRNLTVLASYTYMDLLNTRAAAGAQRHRPIGLPANSAAAWADYTFHGGQLDGFGLPAGVRYLGETFGDTKSTYKMPGVTLFDAGLHYHLAGLGR